MEATSEALLDVWRRMNLALHEIEATQRSLRQAKGDKLSARLASNLDLPIREMCKVIGWIEYAIEIADGPHE